MAVDEVALSIAENGFYRHEPLYAARESGKLNVVEGNRRLAAVKLLRDEKLRRLARIMREQADVRAQGVRASQWRPVLPYGDRVMGEWRRRMAEDGAGNAERGQG
jgi:ParB-like chromosome segregation protein Spo0J